MGIFFGFGHSRLAFSRLGYHLTQRIEDIVVSEYHRYIFEIFAVFRHSGIMQLEGMHIPFRKGFLCKYLCYFSTSVCSEIDTKHRIAFFYRFKIWELCSPSP